MTYFLGITGGIGSGKSSLCQLLEKKGARVFYADKEAKRLETDLKDLASQADFPLEFALPWEGLRPAAGMPAPPRDGDTWRINFSRVQWQHEVVDGRYQKVDGTPEDNWVWTPQGKINMHLPRQWGYVTFK